MMPGRDVAISWLEGKNGLVGGRVDDASMGQGGELSSNPTTPTSDDQPTLLQTMGQPRGWLVPLKPCSPFCRQPRALVQAGWRGRVQLSISIHVMGRETILMLRWLSDAPCQHQSSADFRFLQETSDV